MLSLTPTLLVWILWMSIWAYISASVVIEDSNQDSPDPTSMLGCHQRVYTYKVSKSDSQGRICWDTIRMMSCWGRCDSNEISDWKFPYKRSFHPVCLYGSRELTTVALSNCEDGVEPGTEIYQFMQAVSCRCLICKTSEASCEGLRYRRPPITEEVEFEFL